MDQPSEATFLFTDIEGSTQLWQQHPDVMPGVLAFHDEIVTSAIDGCGGHIVKHTGDGIFAVFAGGEPLAAALDIQRRLAARDWTPLGALRIRMGMHAGLAEQRGDDYFGLPINRAARIMAAGWGGQILLTPEVAALASLPEGAHLYDLGVHMLKDLNEPQPILMLTHPDLIAEFPPLRSLSARPNNLPQQTSPFIGRHNELEEVEHLLTEPGSACRLVTLVGPGGMGKTRLSLQVAAESIDTFKNGVYFVPLAPINSSNALASTVGDALKFTFQAGDPKEQLLHYLEHKEMLLVMDNFEHVIDGATLVADILRSTPSVKVLATSRERLNLQSECLFELGGLDVPAGPDVTIFENFEAVELFIAYARRAQPDYTLAPDERPAVAKICGLLRGMPLGIELAAAWVRTLPPDEIAAELEADLDFLATSMRDVPERHRSMRAVFEYSWNLMTEAEQKVYAQLSVFRGSFSRDAAMKITGAKLPVLAALVDKSLITREADGRYQVHELLRQYAEEKLHPGSGPQPDEAADLHQRHAHYYADALASLEAALMSPAGGATAQAMLRDMDNIRSMWHWTVANRDAEILLKAQFTVEVMYQFLSRFVEGAEMFTLAADALRALPPEGIVGEALAGVLAMLAWFRLRLGQFDAGRAAAEQSIRLHESLGLWPVERFGMHPFAPLSVIETVTGNFDAAVQMGMRLLDESNRRGDRNGRVQANYVLIGAYFAQGDFEKAERYGREALALVHDLQFTWFEAYVRNELGNALRALGRYDEAKTHYQASYAIRSSPPDPEGMAVALNALAQIALLQGDHAEARRLFDHNIATYEEIGDRGGLANALVGLGSAEIALGDSVHPRRNRSLADSDG
jgi:predicted ATPase/class 3 adenylate cyclase